MAKVNRILLLLAVLVLVSLSSLGVCSPHVEVKDLAPTVEHKRITQFVTHFISNYHYKKRPLDDSLSAMILDRYLETLDPNRSYFLYQDIAAFSAMYRDRLDEALKEANLKPAFEIFKVFRTRLDERVRFAKSLLNDEFNFETDEDYIVDRTKLPWATDRAELDEIWRKRVKNDILTLRLAGQKQDQIAAILAKRYDSLARHTHQLNADDVYQFFINAYTTSVEPHTVYFSPRASKDFMIRMSLSLEGIGAVLKTENDYTTIQQVITGGPADRSGKLRAGDRIIGVAQGREEEIIDVVGWRLDDVVDLIRGPKGSVVRLQILPRGAGTSGSPEMVTLVRDTIRLEEQAAQKSVIELWSGKSKSRIGVIKLPSFYMDFTAHARGDKDYRSTTRDVQRLLSELDREGVEGIIIDLRGNGGGSLTEAIELTGLFIETGPIIQVKDAAGYIEVDEDTNSAIAYSGPLAVLVDRQSASASEIFAGAIQDYRRGIIVGEPTFGKGTVQNLLELGRFVSRGRKNLGQLKATVAQFFRISGSSTQHRGIVPDIVFPTALYSSVQGEQDLDNALPWDEVQPVEFTPFRIPVDYFAEVRARHERRVKNDPMFQLLVAEAQFYRQVEQKNRVSLREKQRRKEQEAADKLRRERENQFRLARGLKPSSEESAHDGKEIDSFDVMLYETANILHDLIDAARQTPAMRQAHESGVGQNAAGIAGR